MTTDDPANSRRALTILWLALFGLAILRTAWVSDDAYFTFRTVDNFVHGYGLRWNVAERVQAYTHPLWMAVVAVFYWITGEAFFTSIAISLVLTLLTAWRLLRLASSAWSAAAALAILLCSRAFLDYSTSGLENALTNLLLVLFFGCYLSPRRRPLALSLLAALILLNRLDLAILVLPALIARLTAVGWRDNYRAVAAGFIPFVAWECFSLVYYGFPFPNTAYAKLETGIAESELVRQGLIYLMDSLSRDPLTLLTMIATTAWALVDNPRRTRPIALGVLGYVGYVTYVGGDFMSGRMLEAPLVAAVVILVAVDVAAMFAHQWVPVALAVVIGLNASRAIAFQSQAPGDPNDLVSGSGVSDERLFYFHSNGLLNYSRSTGVWPNSKWTENGLEARREGPRFIMFCCNGMLGYFAGPGVHILDTLALGDPLLARLPTDSTWRIGHFPRAVPRGYGETLETGANRIKAPGLAAYYNRLALVTRGPIWDRRRLLTIVRLNLGQYDALLTDPSAAPACAFSLLTTVQRAPADGGRYSLTAESTVPSACSWHATAMEPWVALTSPSSGTGAGTLNFTVAATRAPSERTGTIVLSWQDGSAAFSVKQAGVMNCTYVLNPSAQDVTSTERDYSLTVTPSDPSCGWKADTDATWLSIVAGSSNTGPGTIVYRAQANGTGAKRAGRINVTGLGVGQSALAITQLP